MTTTRFAQIVARWPRDARLSKNRRGIARQQQLPMRRDRRDSVRHETLMELAKVELRSELSLVIVAQLQNPHLAEKVAAVRRIVCTAFRFAASRRRRNVRIVLEAPLGVVERPLFRVQLDARQQSTDARQRVADLGETQLRIIVAKSLIENHLLCVVRPAVLPGRRLWKRIQSDP